MQSSPREEKAKEEKKIEKQKVKIYNFSTEYICHDLERISRVPDFFVYIYQTQLLL